MNPLQSVRFELEKLIKQKEEIDSRVSVLKEAEQRLEPLYHEDGNRFMKLFRPIPELGITDAVERIMQSSPGSHMSPTDIRDALVAAKYELAGDNPMASIHQVLRRITAKERSPYKAVPSPGGKVLYKFESLSDVPDNIAPQPVDVSDGKTKKK